MARGSGGNVKVKVRRRILSDDESLYIAQSKWDGKGLFTMVPRDEVSSMLDQESRRESIIRMAKNAKGSLSKLTRMSSLKAVSGLRWKDIVMSKQSKSSSHHKGSQGSGSQDQQQNAGFQSQNNSFESAGEGSETDLRRWTLTKQYSSSVNSSSSVTLPPSDQQQQHEMVPKINSAQIPKQKTNRSLNRTPSDHDIQSEGGEENETPDRWKAFKSSSLRFKRLSLKGWRHRK